MSQYPTIPPVLHPALTTITQAQLEEILRGSENDTVLKMRSMEEAIKIQTIVLLKTNMEVLRKDSHDRCHRLETMLNEAQATINKLTASVQQLRDLCSNLMAHTGYENQVAFQEIPEMRIEPRASTPKPFVTKPMPAIPPMPNSYDNAQYQQPNNEDLIRMQQLQQHAQALQQHIPVLGAPGVATEMLVDMVMRNGNAPGIQMLPFPPHHPQ